MRRAAGLAVLLMASACQPAGPSEPIENGAQGDTAAELPRAGKYRVTKVSEIFGVSAGVPGKTESFEACLPQQSEDSLLETTGMNCTPEQVEVADGKISAALMCTAPGTDVQDARLDYRGSYDADGAELTGDVVLPHEMIRLTKKLERIGDC